MDISIKTDIKKVTRYLTDIQKKQIPFATMLALNDTAFKAKQKATTALDVQLDRPTKFTTSKGAIKVTKAKKKSLSSTVFIEPKRAKYLRGQITGGTEYAKGKAHLVPAGAKLNKFGNIPRATQKKFFSNSSKYFSGVPKGKPSAAAGVWERYGSKKNPRFKRVAVYKQAVTYKPRYHFQEIIKEVVKREFPRAFSKRLNQALATAK